MAVPSLSTNLQETSIKNLLIKRALLSSAMLFATPAMFAADAAASINLLGHWAAILALVIFIVAYPLVIGEEMIHLRKSKPVMVAAGFVWALVAIAYAQAGQSELVEELVRHGLLGFVELFLFLLAAMTYINTMDERGVFDVLRAWLLAQNMTLRK